MSLRFLACAVVVALAARAGVDALDPPFLVVVLLGFAFSCFVWLVHEFIQQTHEGDENGRDETT